MPRWLIYFIIIVFVVHFILFLRLFLRHRRTHHILTTFTFFFLVLSFSLRLLPTSVRFWDIRVYWYPRLISWLFFILSMYFLIRYKLEEKKKLRLLSKED